MPFVVKERMPYAFIGFCGHDLDVLDGYRLIYVGFYVDLTWVARACCCLQGGAPSSRRSYVVTAAAKLVTFSGLAHGASEHDADVKNGTAL